MKWRRKTDPLFDQPGVWFDKFAFLPRRVGDFWIWLRWYQVRFIEVKRNDGLDGTAAYDFVFERRSSGCGHCRMTVWEHVEGYVKSFEAVPHA